MKLNIEYHCLYGFPYIINKAEPDDISNVFEIPDDIAERWLAYAKIWIDWQDEVNKYMTKHFFEKEAKRK